MPRYFFDLIDGDGITHDMDGTVFADAGSADQCAVGMALGIMAAEVAMGSRTLSCTIHVRDADRSLVTTVPFNYAIALHRA